MRYRPALPLALLLAVGCSAEAPDAPIVPEPVVPEPVAPGVEVDEPVARAADRTEAIALPRIPALETVAFPTDEAPSAAAEPAGLQSDGLEAISSDPPEPVAAAPASEVDSAAVTAAEERPAAAESASPYADLTPQKALALLHAPQVHRELRLSDEQIDELETFFDTTDGPWFRSRILPPEEQRAAQDALASHVDRWMTEHASPQQRQRLLQLEYQAVGPRSLLRDDLSEQLALDESQRKRFAVLARAMDDAQGRLQQSRMRGEQDAKLSAAAVAAGQAERDGLSEILSPVQQRRLGAALGEPFDVAALERIYPQAPEFEPGSDWLNSTPLTMEELRGKVVLVHFYAFQCHNCHANFEIYRRWHERYDDADVVVIGIQTPETRRERDPDAVRAAAEERGLEFPILVDLDSKNWKAWGNTMWPTVYVVDRNGYLRHWWQGEMNWNGATGDETIETLVDRLIAEDADAR